jgi:hypothetical protein
MQEAFSPEPLKINLEFLLAKDDDFALGEP